MNNSTKNPVFAGCVLSKDDALFSVKVDASKVVDSEDGGVLLDVLDMFKNALVQVVGEVRGKELYLKTREVYDLPGIFERGVTHDHYFVLYVFEKDVLLWTWEPFIVQTNVTLH